MIGDDVIQSEHPRIMQANENYIDWKLIQTAVKEINEAYSDQNDDIIKKNLLKYVKEYQPII